MQLLLMTRLLTLLLMWQLLLPVTVAEEMRVKKLSVEEGLSQSMVSTLLEDSRGYMWIGTESGLNRYDGHKFRHFYQMHNKSDSLPDSTITALYEDFRGKIWVGTTEGIGVHNPNEFLGGDFTRIQDPGDQTKLPSNFIIGITQDTHGQIWIATLGGVAVYDMELNKLKSFVYNDYAKDSATSILARTNGTIVVTTDQGIFHYRQDNYESTYSDFFNKTSQYIRATYESFDGKLWITTSRGLFVYDDQTGSYSEVLNPANQQSFNDLWSLTEDFSGNLWLSHANGLYQLHYQSGELRNYSEIVNLTIDTINFAIPALAFDSNGFLWMGTQGHGATIWNPESQIFTVYSKQTKSQTGLTYNSTWSIHQDNQSGLWIGTERGLNYLGFNQERFQHFLAENSQLKHDNIYDISSYDEQHIIVAHELGVQILNVDSLAFAPLPNSIEQVLANQEVYYLHNDGQGSLWFSTSNQIYQYIISEQLMIERPSRLVGGEHMGLYRTTANYYTDPQGVVWIGTDLSLNRYDPASGQFNSYLELDPSSTNVDSSTISAIASNRPNEIWVGYTGNGMAKLVIDQQLQTIERKNYSITSGLPTGNIYGIIPDNERYLWVATGIGLLYFDTLEATFKQYTAFDGLPSNEFNDGAYLKTKQGDIYFGGIAGVVKIPTDSIQPHKIIPDIRYTDYSVATATSNEWQPNVPPHVVLTHLDTVLTVGFSIFDFWNPNQANYQYKLPGLNSEWVRLGSQNQVTFNNLSPGDYELSVRGVNQQGQTSSAVTLPITVLPPPWRSNEAYTLYLAVLLGLVYFAYSFRSRLRAERKAANRQINLFAMAFKNTSEGVIILDQQRKIVAANLSSAKILGFNSIEQFQQENQLFSQDAATEGYVQHIWKTLEYDGEWQGELTQKTHSGETIVLDINISRVAEQQGTEEGHFVAVFSDITTRKNNEKELRHLANFDTLTQLPNRTLFQDRLQHAIAHAHRETQRIALLFLDLDRFKQINDSLGHDVGDMLLQAVAKRIKHTLREDDTLARLGGDEFVIILENVQSINYITHVCDTIIEQFQRPFELSGLHVNTSTSIGISLYPHDGKNSTELLKNADTAMYHAKNQGRGNFQFYTKELNAQALERLSLENDLRHSLAGQHLDVYYQPRIDLNSHKVVSVEALARWRHPTKGMIPPVEFISIAEESGLILELSHWILEASCKQLKSWHQQGFEDLRVSINLSAKQFQQEDLYGALRNVLDKYQLSPASIEVEITESTIMKDIDKTISVLEKIRNMGVQIAVDDFGTGYSSLSYIQRFPINTLKIDRSFIKEVTNNNRGRALVDIVINLAKNLGLRVVAEGVETKSQLAYLYEQSCDEVQGFYFARPQSAEDIVSLFNTRFK